MALTSVAFAADDKYADLYANTLVYTSPDNVVTKVLVQKDGTWTSSDSNKKTDNGEWATLGGYVCVTDGAKPKTKPMCSKAVMHKVGDKWSEPGEKKGTMDQVTLSAGR